MAPATATAPRMAAAEPPTPASSQPIDSGTSEPKTDPVLEKVTAATKKQDWASAQAMLREALAANPQNANYHNMFAYSVRKGANPDMNVVFKHYNEALRLDPKLKGAPTGYTFHVREVRASVGAGFIYPLAGDMMTMPGLGADPAAHHIDIDENGETVGLF